jgi:hypothetical protein
MSGLGMFVHGFMRTDVAAHISLYFWIWETYDTSLIFMISI